VKKSLLTQRAELERAGNTSVHDTIAMTRCSLEGNARQVALVDLDVKDITLDHR
jgi:hypothetical protein